MTPDSGHVIEIEALSVFAGQTLLLGPVSLDVQAGGTLIIMGETGAGKSLIAQAILGSLPKGLRAEGMIRINGERVDHLSWSERAQAWGREISMLPQEPWRALDPLMRSATQVSEAHQFVAGRTRREAAIAARDDFSALGLTGSERRLPGALSGGMAQRVAFAAATAGNAPILIADEPTKGLDSARTEKTIAMLSEVPGSGGTLLAITHDSTVAERLGGNVMVLRHGRVVERGLTSNVLKSPSNAYTRSLLAANPAAWPKPGQHPVGAATLTAKDLAVSRGEGHLIEGFNLHLHAGDRVAITGPSGVGKTSLLDTLAGLLKPAAGRVDRAPDTGRNAVQKLYQDPPSAFPPRVTLGRSLRDVATLHGVDWSTVSGTLARLGIAPALLDRYPAAVSGGELQRIAIARALAARPAVLLADEPTSRLDPITQRETMELLSEIATDQSVAVVLVTHDLVMAERWADKVHNIGP